MDNIKDNHYYVGKLMGDLEFIMKYTNDVSPNQFASDELLQDSMMFRLIQISENVLKLSEDFKESYSKIPWVAIKGLRNRIVHDYGNVDLTIVFDTIKKRISWKFTVCLKRCIRVYKSEIHKTIAPF